MANVKLISKQEIKVTRFPTVTSCFWKSIKATDRELRHNEEPTNSRTIGSKRLSYHLADFLKVKSRLPERCHHQTDSQRLGYLWYLQTLVPYCWVLKKAVCDSPKAYGSFRRLVDSHKWKGRMATAVIRQEMLKSIVSKVTKAVIEALLQTWHLQSCQGRVSTISLVAWANRSPVRQLQKQAIFVKAQIVLTMIWSPWSR